MRGAQLDTTRHVLIPFAVQLAAFLVALFIFGAIAFAGLRWYIRDTARELLADPPKATKR